MLLKKLNSKISPWIFLIRTKWITDPKTNSLTSSIDHHHIGITTSRLYRTHWHICLVLVWQTRSPSRPLTCDLLDTAPRTRVAQSTVTVVPVYVSISSSSLEAPTLQFHRDSDLPSNQLSDSQGVPWLLPYFGAIPFI